MKKPIIAALAAVGGALLVSAAYGQQKATPAVLVPRINPDICYDRKTDAWYASAHEAAAFFAEAETTGGISNNRRSWFDSAPNCTRSQLKTLTFRVDVSALGN